MSEDRERSLAARPAADAGLEPGIVGLVDRLRAVAPHGPVLVIADDEHVGRSARSWAIAFARAGWEHRVSVAAPPAFAAADLDDLVADARGSGARAIVLAGRGCDLLAGRLAAATGLPLVLVGDSDSPPN